MKMEITGNAMPSPIVAITPMTIRYHSGAVSLTIRRNEGSGRALSCLSNYIGNNKIIVAYLLSTANINQALGIYTSWSMHVTGLVKTLPHSHIKIIIKLYSIIITYNLFRLIKQNLYY